MKTDRVVHAGITLPLSMIERLDKLAKEEGRSRSNLAARLLEKALKEAKVARV